MRQRAWTPPCRTAARPMAAAPTRTASPIRRRTSRSSMRARTRSTSRDLRRFLASYRMGRCRRFRNAVFAALILAAPAAAAQDLDQIKAQLAAQQAEIARLRADLEAEQKARAEDKPAVTARRWGLAISGFVQ